jgi:hypothetical protein
MAKKLQSFIMLILHGPISGRLGLETRESKNGCEKWRENLPDSTRHRFLFVHSTTIQPSD